MSKVIDKYRKLVELLYKKTNEGNIKWSEDEVDDSFNVSLGQSRVEVDSTTDENDDPIIIVRVYADGKMTERFDDNDIKGIRPSIPGYDSYYKLMSETYKMAQRTSTGADIVLDGIIQELEGK